MTARPHRVRFIGGAAVARRPIGLALWLAVAAVAPARAQIVFHEASDPDIEWQRDLSSYAVHVAFSGDGEQVVLLHESDRWQAVTTFDVANGATVREQAVRLDGIARAIAVSANGRLAVAAPGHVDVFDLSSGQPVLDRFECAGCNISALAFSPDGSTLAMQDVRAPRERALGVGAARILDLETMRVAELEAIAGSRRAVSFSPDGGRLLTAHTAYLGAEEYLGFRVWATAGPRLLYTASFTASTMGAIGTGAVDGADFVAVNGNGGNIEMRDLTNEVLLWSVPMIPNPYAGAEGLRFGVELEHVAIAADGSFVVSYERPGDGVGSLSVRGVLVRESGGIVVRRGSDGGIIAVYDVPGVTALAVAPDSRTFAFATPRRLPRLALVRAPR